MKLLHNEFVAEPRNVTVKKFEIEESFDDEPYAPKGGIGEERISIASGWLELKEDPKPVTIQGLGEIAADGGEPIQTEPVSNKDKADAIIVKANNDAEIIIANANGIVEKIREGAEAERQAAIEAGRKEGYDVGFKEGEVAGEIHAKEAYTAMMQDTNKAFLKELKRVLEDISGQKEKFAKKYYGQLCDLAITVAEKIIKVSLSSSGQIIERMVTTATEKCADKQWATVHISDSDEKVLVQGDVDLLEAVKSLSPNLKLEIKAGGELGTCIVEMPDQIIDASVSTQLENIKEIIDDHKWNGED